MRLMLKCKTYVTLEGYQEAYGNDSWRAWNLRQGDRVSGWQYEDDDTVDVFIYTDEDDAYRFYTFTLDEDWRDTFEILEHSE